MKIANTQVLNSSTPMADQMSVLQTQMDKVYTCLQGRVSFGTGATGVDGQNIEGKFMQFTSSGTPDAENTIAHNIGSIPIGYLVMNQDKAGSLYSSATAWTSSNMYLKCSVASVTFLIFVVKKGQS